MTQTSRDTEFQALVGDIGGTHARFALVDLAGKRPALSQIREFSSASYASGRDIVRDYLSSAKLGRLPPIAAIAVAGPVAKGSVHFTNLGWALAESDLLALGFATARLLNDFESLALATTHLTEADLHALGPARPADFNYTVAVIGPGTGFGASALVRGSDGRAIAMAAEGGHASFAPSDEVERNVLKLLAEKFAHVSIERVLSGPGLHNLHHALNAIEGVVADAENPEEITKRGLAGEAPYARTLARFCAILGSVAGDFALYYGARGGVFIAGGIAPTILPALGKSEFRRRFEAKGRFDAYLAPIPTAIILHSHAAFLGAAELARHLARDS